MTSAHNITVRTISVRSTNIERDLEQVDLTRLNLTGRGNDVLRRVDDALRRTERDRAWSITGPYGSGKSSFALLLANLVSTNPTRRDAALRRVHAADATLAASLGTALHDVAPRGMVRAVAVARREPIALTVVRALQAAASDLATFRGSAAQRARKFVQSLGSDADTAPSSAELLDALRAVTEVAPTLLILDEFGKSLEYQASRTLEAEADLYLLQELSELSASSAGLPTYLLTLQHLGFLDYAGSSDALQRREWSKIQGRFEDVLFVENSTESARLIAEAIEQPTRDAARREAYGAQAAAAWEDAGLSRVLGADASLFAGVFPLHPLLTVAAPLVFGTLAQNDRTLTGFLAGDEPHTLADYLRENPQGTSGDTASLPTLKLPALYDYLATGARTSLLASSSAGRWLEIETRISEARALPQDDLDLLKSVAILNLVDAGGALRASADNISFALLEPHEWLDGKARRKIQARLKKSSTAAFLHYRAYSDEWRLWQGSDVDLTSRIERARANLVNAPIVDVLPAGLLPSAIVAGRHAQVVGMLRHFAVAVSDAHTPSVPAPADDAAEDGLLLFHLGAPDSLPTTVGNKPVLVGTSPDAKLVIDAAVELAACHRVMNSGDLDNPATAELRERIAQARTHLAATFAEAFRPGRPDAQWLLDGQALDGQRSLSALVSAACDAAYPLSPRIRNEMLGRHTLTSQGAKARRVLIELCLNDPADELLGMDTNQYGPERAMFEGVVRYLGLHVTSRAGAGFHAPAKDSTVAPAWNALTKAMLRADAPVSFQSLYELLMAPPFGVKSGVVPLLITAALTVHRDDVAVFDDGTYQPTVTPALMERLVKTPDRFTVSATSSSRGARAELLNQLTTALNLPDSGNRPKLLRVVNGFLSRIRDLDGYAMRTRQLPDAALNVRQAAVTASDPARLIFEDLPRAVGKKPVTASTSAADLKAIVKALLSALDTLERVRPTLEAAVIETLSTAFAAPNDLAGLRRELRNRVALLQGAKLDAGLAGLVNHALNDMPDEDWLEPLALLIAARAFNSWADDDLARLSTRARQLAGALHEARVLHADEAAHDLVSFTGRDGSRHALLLDGDVDERLRTDVTKLLGKAAERHGDNEAAARAILRLLLPELTNAAKGRT